MSEPYDYGKRADELADAMRRYLIGINTGGVAIALTFAANMAEKGVHPAWVVCPVFLFALGLGISGGSLLYAKHKALKKKKAVNEDTEIPKYDACCQQNFTYELITLLVFLVAASFALYQVKGLVIEPPPSGSAAPSPSSVPNHPVKRNALPKQSALRPLPLR